MYLPRLCFLQELSLSNTKPEKLATHICRRPPHTYMYISIGIHIPITYGSKSVVVFLFIFQ